jgi:hypothetical protein
MIDITDETACGCEKILVKFKLLIISNYFHKFLHWPKPEGALNLLNAKNSDQGLRVSRFLLIHSCGFRSSTLGTDKNILLSNYY